MHNTFSKKRSVTSVLLLSLLIGACSGGGGSGSSAGGDGTGDQPVTTGVFIDSAVGNIQYRTVNSAGETLRTGVTNSAGEFEYQYIGESVIFSIGDIEFPTVVTNPIITPLEIAGAADISDVVVQNIARLLISLDEDGDPDNGITITEQGKSAAQGAVVDFRADDFDEQVTDIVAASGAGDGSVASLAKVVAHLEINLGDNDGDGVINLRDALPEDASEQQDSDGDGVGDRSDYAKDDPAVQTICQSAASGEEKEQAGCDNVAPVAVIGYNGANAVALNSEPVFDASESFDIDSDSLNYSWSIQSQPDQAATVSLSNELGVNSGLVNLNVAGEYIVALTVSDNFSAENTSTLTIIVEPDTDFDGIIDSLDAFPTDPNETIDSDSDGVGDNGDFAPQDDSIQTVCDTDASAADKLAANCDPATFDSDNDGVVDADDAFPFDSSESVDADLDGTGANTDFDDNDFNVQTICQTDATPQEKVDGGCNDDSDGDGFINAEDAFPANILEWLDEDEDGVGANSDYDDSNALIQTICDTADGSSQVRVESACGDNQPPTAVITYNGATTFTVTDAALVLTAEDSVDDFDAGSDLSYSWSLSVPSGSSASLTSTSAIDTRVTEMDVAGTYTIRLVVSDGVASSVTEELTITTELIPYTVSGSGSSFAPSVNLSVAFSAVTNNISGVTGLVDVSYQGFVNTYGGVFYSGTWTTVLTITSPFDPALLQIITTEYNFEPGFASNGVPVPNGTGGSDFGTTEVIACYDAQDLVFCDDYPVTGIPRPIENLSVFSFDFTDLQNLNWFTSSSGTTGSGLAIDTTINYTVVPTP